MDVYEGLKRMPLLRLLIPFILGIILQNNIRLPLAYILPVFGFVFLLLCFIWKYNPANSLYSIRWLYGLALNCFILLAAMCLMGRKLQTFSFLDHSGSGDYVIARVLEYPLERERSYRILIEPLRIISDDAMIRTSGRALAWFEKDSSAAVLRTGDRIVLANKFNEIRNAGNPFEFDFRRYMRIQGVFAETYVAGDSWFLEDKAEFGGPIMISARLREYLLGVLRNNNITGKEYAVAGALLLGYRGGLDQDIRQSYAASGAMHILAVSGLHVGILYVLLYWMMGLIKNIRYFSVVSSLIILLVIWSYAFITGLSPSVTRSATMFSFVAVAKSLRRSTNIYNTLASSAFIQLTADPFMLFMVGFQLSYLAVAGIAYYQPFIYSLFRFRNPVTDKIWALGTVSFSAQFLIFPLIIYYFNQFPNYFLLTNIIAVPLAMIILYSGLILFLFAFIPVLSSVIAFFLNIALTLLNCLTDTINYLPFSHTSDIFIGIPLLLILYGVILFISLFLAQKKIRFLHFAMILAIAGFTIRADYNIKTAGQQIFIIYNSGRHSLYNFISGNDNIIISAREDDLVSKSLPYHTLRPALNLNAVKFDIVLKGDFFDPGSYSDNYPFFMNGNFIDFAGYTIYFARDELRSVHMSQPVHTDLVVICSQFTLEFKEITNSIIAELVVIDSSVPDRRRAKLIGQCREAGINYHDVRASGAYVVSLNPNSSIESVYK